MKDKSIYDFFKKYFSNFFEAVVNLFIFFPYFFSLKSLLKTLFKPWKNLMQKKSAVGFSFQEWFGRLTFNLISRGIGFVMRLSIILFFLFFQGFFVLSLPFIFLIFLFLTPLYLLIYVLKKSDEKVRTELAAAFVSSHLLQEKNRLAVEEWFKEYYHFYHLDYRWWKLSNLLSTPPLARDWAVGFTPTLDQYTDDLTSASYQNQIKNIINRQKEIAEIETILSRNEDANVVIVGEEGVGKHSIIDAMAKRIYEGKINPLLVYKRVLKLNLEKILTQTTDQKQREAQLETLLEEAVEAKNIVLIVENLDKYVAATTDRINLSTAFEKFAGHARINLIATATPFNFQKFIFPNAQINRLFAKIDVREVSKADATTILLTRALEFEKKNKVIIPYETVVNTIEKSAFFITDIPFPEKAIELLDSAAAYAVQKKAAATIVTPDIIDLIITETTHIPTQLNSDLKQKLINLEKELVSRVIFQNEAMNRLTSAVQKAFLVLGQRARPLASFLFLGPTGVGKTETAKALTQIFFNDEKYLIRFDMSLYQTKNDIEKLIGSSESQNPGLLTQAIRNNPYGVLLLDEIEKADPNLLNIFLTILDEGYFTDGTGRHVDCKNLVIIATSNAGSDLIYKNLNMDSQTLINHLVESKIFTPEFLNRFDGVIAYKPLSKEAIWEIAKRIVTQMTTSYARLHNVNVTITDQMLRDALATQTHPEFGARDLQRVIAQEIESKITRQVLEQI